MNDLESVESVVMDVIAALGGPGGPEALPTPEVMEIAQTEPEQLESPRYQAPIIRKGYVSKLAPLEPMFEPRPKFKIPVQRTCTFFTHMQLAKNTNDPVCGECGQHLIRAPKNKCEAHRIYCCSECFSAQQIEQFAEQRRNNER